MPGRGIAEDRSAAEGRAYAAVSLDLAGLGLAGWVVLVVFVLVVARYAAGPAWAFLSICPSGARAAGASRPTSMA